MTMDIITINDDTIFMSPGTGGSMIDRSILALGLLAVGLTAFPARAESPFPSLGNESIFLRNIEVIQEPNILFVDRIVNGRAYGMDGEVAIRMLKLANGQFLLSPQWLSAEAREFNARMCESTGGVPVADERAVIVIGETTVLAKCSRDKADLKQTWNGQLLGWRRPAFPPPVWG
jgi:hypothetical protein